MITKLKHRGFHVCHKSLDDRYLEILDNILSCNVKNISIPMVFKSEPHTHVSLLDTRHGKFVLKIYSPRSKLAERFVKSLFCKNYNENLIHRIDEAESDGYTFPNNFYLLAERRVLTFAKVSIMLFEYIPGPELRDIPAITPAMKSEIKESMREMHAREIISGDAHGGNFILSQQGIRIIDLSGKPYSARRAVEDYVTANIRLGVPVETQSLWEKSLVARRMKRHLKIKHRKMQSRRSSIDNNQTAH
jgi:heptose II phosphotransferase